MYDGYAGYSIGVQFERDSEMREEIEGIDVERNVADMTDCTLHVSPAEKWGF